MRQNPADPGSAKSLARPLLFLGYSLHDVNTRYLLWKLQQIRENSAWAEHRPASYILMTEKSSAQAAVLRHRGIESLVVEAADPGSATLELQRRLRALLDAKPGKHSHRKASAAKVPRKKQ